MSSTNEDTEMGRFLVELVIANQRDVMRAEDGEIESDEVKRLKIKGVIDSGATRLVLPKKVVDQLGLPYAGTTKVRYADQRYGTRKMVKHIWLELLGRSGAFSAIVEPKRENALIGAIVLDELDFMVDCTTQTLHPRDPKQIVSEIE